MKKSIIALALLLSGTVSAQQLENQKKPKFSKTITFCLYNLTSGNALINVEVDKDWIYLGNTDTSGCITTWIMPGTPAQMRFYRGDMRILDQTYNYTGYPVTAIFMEPFNFLTNK